MSEILDTSKSYLSIFTKAVKVDKNLPKWRMIEKEKEVSKSDSNTNGGLTLVNNNDALFEIEERLISLDQFINMDKADYNIYIGKRVAQDMSNNSGYSIDFDSIGISESIDPKLRKVPFIKKVTRFYREFINSNKKTQEEVFELNVFDFFDKVKLTAKENESQYAMRIEPYMIAMKQAQEMGQTALVDKLTAELFNNKYESILYAENMHYKVTEDQLVSFVKKTEKGVRLDYIANFSRPVPQAVIDAKKKADDLLVFDNYCVLYYDPDAKSFSQTEAEKEKERQKKSDPILFGMISGSRNLYYVTDWIDEYCDLTLNEFIKVSGIDKQHLEINEKIKI